MRWFCDGGRSRDLSSRKGRSALARGAKIYCELAGYAMEAMEMQSRLRWKMTRCVKMNLPGARWYKIQKDETSSFLMLQVWSVTSTPLEDRAECTALRQVAVANTFQKLNFQ